MRHAGRLLEKYPGACVIGNTKTATMAGQFFRCLRKRQVHRCQRGGFYLLRQAYAEVYMAPMVHWPEAMVTYDETSGSLFSADAFGTWRLLTEIFLPMKCRLTWTAPDLLYKYSREIRCSGLSLAEKGIGSGHWHGMSSARPRVEGKYRNVHDKYVKWSSYTPEDKAVVIACASIYGNTERACERLAFLLGERGVKDIRLYDLSRTHVSVVWPRPSGAVISCWLLLPIITVYLHPWKRFCLI